MASLKVDTKQFHKKSSSYFLSSGGQTTQARGFAFLHLANRYIVILSTNNKQWKLETRDLPQGWINVAFTWKKHDLLRLYVNGREVASGKSVTVSRPKDMFSTLEIGRPNNSHSPNFRVSLEIDNLALWEKALTSDEIDALANKGKNILLSPLLLYFTDIIYYFLLLITFLTLLRENICWSSTSHLWEAPSFLKATLRHRFFTASLCRCMRHFRL